MKLKPFKINRNSWHYKLNQNFFNDRQYYMESWEDKHDNFCSYWRVTMFRLVFALAGAVFILLVLSMIGAGIYQDPLKALIIVGSTVGILSAVFGIFLFSMYLDERKSKRNYEDIPDSLFVAKYKSYKSKVCPMVEYDK
jgi:lipopolysaccharide/colanic/teichoic acid biosynthesis glycosyltransferase